MPLGLDKLKHIVVLMMENRSFDHMLGALKATDPRIDGLDGDAIQPGHDRQAAPAAAAGGVSGAARSRSRPSFPRRRPADLQRRHDAWPRRDDAGVREELLRAAPGREALAQDHVPLHAGQAAGADDARDRVRGLQRLVLVHSRPDALQPRVRALRDVVRPRRHGDPLYRTRSSRASTSGSNAAGKTAKIYYFDHQELVAGSRQPAAAPAAVLRDVPAVPRRLRQRACCPTIRSSSRTTAITKATAARSSRRTSTPTTTCRKANGSSPRSTTRSVRTPRSGSRPRCSSSTTSTAASTITCRRRRALPDGFVAQPDATDTGKPFLFDRLGVRVPAILVSPWIPPGTVVGTHRVFEHASIPATATSFFLGQFDDRSPREKQAETFLDLLTLNTMRTDAPEFDLG